MTGDMAMMTGESFLLKNLAALEKRDARLAELIQNLAADAQVRIIPASNGDLTAAFVHPDGTTKRIHSSRDPRRDAMLWAQELKMNPSQSVALFGLGLGYPLKAFLDLYREKVGALWCFESSPALFKAMLERADWSEVLADPRIAFMVGIGELEFRRITAGGFQKIIVDGIEVVEYGPAVQVAPEWYRERQENVRDLIRQWTAEMLTSIQRGPLFQSNTLANLSSLGEAFLFRDIGSMIANRPAIMVSAGPSLNRNVHKLHRAKGRIPIISVDTSLRILQKHGITPDLVVSIDGLGLSAKHFEGVINLEKIPLAFDLEVTPSVLKPYPGPCFLVGNKKPMVYSWLEDAIGPLEGLTKGLTVAQAAYLLLAHYGAEPIILVGQDLSFERQGGATHADGAAFQGRYEPDPQGGGRWEDPLKPDGLKQVPILQVPANDGGFVPTTQTLYAYLKRFEEDIARSGKKTLNATEGGALIQGAHISTLDQIYDDLGVDQLPAFEGFLSSHNLEPIGIQFRQEYQSFLSEICQTLKMAENTFLEGVAQSQRLAADLSWEKLADSDIQSRFNMLFRLFDQVRQSKKIQMLIDRGVMKSLYFLHKGDLPEPEKRTREQHKMVAERYLLFFEEALEMARRGIQLLS